MMGANGHDDLYYKQGCGRNFTDDGLSAFNDQIGHGTHVLGIIAGTGSADSRFRGVAPSVGLLGGGGIRAAKVFRKDDNAPGGGRADVPWVLDAMDWMSLSQDECGFPMPLIVNYSGGGHGTSLTGTDDESRRLDQHVWTYRQLVRGRRRQRRTGAPDDRQTRRGQECAHRRQRARLRGPVRSA